MYSDSSTFKAISAFLIGLLGILMLLGMFATLSSETRSRILQRVSDMFWASAWGSALIALCALAVLTIRMIGGDRSIANAQVLAIFGFTALIATVFGLCAIIFDRTTSEQSKQKGTSKEI